MIKTYLECECSKPCPYSSTCCRVPTEVVRHEGREGIDLFIFGMGAGKDEEKQRKCFVGKAGKYMRSIIKHLWDNPDVGPFNIAISNNVRFHPMDPYGKDREPTSEEIDRCVFHLSNDINTLKPKVIMPVGKNATSTFISIGDSSMGSLRGCQFSYTRGGNNITMIPTWHPSYLARNYGRYDPDGNNQFDKEFISDILLALELGNEL